MKVSAQKKPGDEPGQQKFSDENPLPNFNNLPAEKQNAVEDEKQLRPDVEISKDENDDNLRIIAIIGRFGFRGEEIDAENIRYRTFLRAGILCFVAEAIDPLTGETSLKILNLSAPTLRERITQTARLFQVAKNKNGEAVEKEIKPTQTRLDQILKRGDYSNLIKQLIGIIQSPTVRTDGTLLQSPGYDAESCLIFHPNAEFPIVDENPTLENAKTAFNRLLSIVKDFPFAAENDKSAWIALVLTLIGRPAIDGCVPMFSVSANIRGAGKSLLCDVASVIAFGTTAARQVYSSSAEEIRKVITMIAIEARNAVLFDNVDRRIEGAALDAALTSEKWQDRVLGQSKSTESIPLRTVFMTTGNNIEYGTDIARRVLPIRLDSALESPEERNDFEKADLISYVRENRGELAAAALTIIRAFISAGKPEMSGGEFGSFEKWTELIRGAIVWIGAADPLITRETAKDSDSTTEELGLLIAGLKEADPEGDGMTAADIVRKVEQQGNSKDEYSNLCDAIRQGLGKRLSVQSVGNYLSKRKGRIINGHRLEKRKLAGSKNIWIVTEVKKQQREDLVALVDLSPVIQVIEKNINIHTAINSANNRNSINSAEYGQLAGEVNQINQVNTAEFDNDHSKVNQVNHSEYQTVHCSKCSANMTPSEAGPVGDFINFDCSCGNVKAIRLKDVLKPRRLPR